MRGQRSEPNNLPNYNSTANGSGPPPLQQQQQSGTQTGNGSIVLNAAAVQHGQEKSELLIQQEDLMTI